MKSILQDWVNELGLRHQGVLVSAVRGCDTVARDDPIKLLCRVLRAVMLNAHCGDVKKSKSYIEMPEEHEIQRRMDLVIKDHDALPHHYLMHLVHAACIIGYKHPSPYHKMYWRYFYEKMVHKMHFNIETEEQLDRRLNADEETFKANQ